jgi:hypothetical protein
LPALHPRRVALAPERECALGLAICAARVIMDGSSPLQLWHPVAASTSCPRTFFSIRDCPPPVPGRGRVPGAARARPTLRPARCPTASPHERAHAERRR